MGTIYVASIVQTLQNGYSSSDSYYSFFSNPLLRLKLQIGSDFIESLCCDLDVSMLRCLITTEEHAITKDQIALYVFPKLCREGQLAHVMILVEEFRHQLELDAIPSDLFNFFHPSCSVKEVEVIKYLVENGEYERVRSYYREVKGFISFCCQVLAELGHSLDLDSQSPLHPRLIADVTLMIEHDMNFYSVNGMLTAHAIIPDEQFRKDTDFELTSKMLHMYLKAGFDFIFLEGKPTIARIEHEEAAAQGLMLSIEEMINR